MAKKGMFEKLLGGIISPSKKVPRQWPEELVLSTTARKVEDQAPRPKKEPGVLDPLMNVLEPDEKSILIAGLMDFIGDFLVKMLDQYNFELTKVENTISAFQSTMLNQVRLIRNQIDIARQQGHFKVQQPAPPFQMPPGASIPKPVAPESTPDGLQKKRQPTERDIMDIAASIRTLVTRQKLVKDTGEGATEAPAMADQVPSEAATEATKPAGGTILPLDSKIEQFQKRGDEQKQRIENMSKAPRPAETREELDTGEAVVMKPAGSKKVPAKKPASQKPAAKPAGKQAAGKKAPKTPAKKPATAQPATTMSPEKPATKKLDKERDLLPDGFQQELMKNIKDLMKDKKNPKKP
jgi:hypothetical protein